MSDLKPREMRIIERSLDMAGGYVLDFSNRTFAEFFEHELGIDIYDGVWSSRGESKANRLRSYLLGATAASVARALRALWAYRQDTQQQPAPEVESERFLAIAARLEAGNSLARTDAIEPFVVDETLEELVAGIERDVQADSPRAALDRLHTYCMKKFAHLLQQHRPGVDPADTLNGRAGQYFNALRREAKVRDHGKHG